MSKAAVKRQSLFPGGLVLPARKGSAGAPIRSLALPPQVHIPLPGKPGEARLLVAPGDTVRTGQVLACLDEALGFACHASLSGRVREIAPRPLPLQDATGQRLRQALCVTIDSDGRDLPAPARPDPWWRERDRLTLLERIAAAGVRGLGGAGFPAWRKLSAPSIHTLIINACECEPYISADEALLRAHADEVAAGVAVLLHLLGPRLCLVAIEDDKPEARVALETALAGLSDPRVTLHVLPARYPSGAERLLIHQLTGFTLPTSRLPIEAGLLCHNVGSVLAIQRAVVEGQPLIERICTLSGEALGAPGNYRIRLGTPLGFALAQAGLALPRLGRLIAGGPLMGVELTQEAVEAARAQPEPHQAEAPRAKQAHAQRPQPSSLQSDAQQAAGPRPGLSPVGPSSTELPAVDPANPDLSSMDLTPVDPSQARLSSTNLRPIDPSHADPSSADLPPVDRSVVDPPSADRAPGDPPLFDVPARQTGRPAVSDEPPLFDLPAAEARHRDATAVDPPLFDLPGPAPSRRAAPVADPPLFDLPAQGVARRDLPPVEPRATVASAPAEGQAEAELPEALAELPLLAHSNCLIAASESELPRRPAPQPCIRCGQCAEVCPTRLQPQLLWLHGRAGAHEKAAALDLADCIECGACSEVCPSHLPLVEQYRHSKAALRAAAEERRRAEHARRRFEQRQARLARQQEREEARRRELQAQTADDRAAKAGSPPPAIAAALARVKAKRSQGGAGDGE